jgi:hypothetical protein
MYCIHCIRVVEQRTRAGARRYDSREGIGRVESGTETENNAGNYRGVVVDVKKSPKHCETYFLYYNFVNN